MKKLRVAVIGAGKLGSRHADVYSKLPEIELVGVCDILETRAKEVARRCHTRPFTDYRELIKSVDAASIVVPSHLHYEISRSFLENAVHLLIEKPMTTDLSHAKNLIALAQEKNLTIAVGHIERFNSAIRAIRNIIKLPRFIECLRLGPYDPRVADVGVTLDLMIHDIDIVLNLIRSPVKMVDAVGAAILSKTDDIANARIRFMNDSVCNLTASRVSPEVSRRIRIFQDNAYITIDYVTQQAEIYTKEDGRIKRKKIDIKKSDSLVEELSDFIDCIRVGRRPEVSGEEGLQAVEVALSISNQIKNTIVAT